jgi:hypothetical protein
MKNGDYFEGIFYSAVDNPNDNKIELITKDKGWGEFGYYKHYWYYMENNKLHYSSYKPNKGNEITYQEFEDWILGSNQSQPVYEVY